MIASVVSYIIFVSLNGYEALFDVPAMDLSLDLTIVVGIIALGAIVGLAGRFFITTMHLTEYVTKRSTVPLAIKIMLGGLLVGIIGVFVPEVLGTSEDTIAALIEGSIISLGFAHRSAHGQAGRHQLHRRQRWQRRGVLPFAGDGSCVRGRLRHFP